MQTTTSTTFLPIFLLVPLVLLSCKGDLTSDDKHPLIGNGTAQGGVLDASCAVALDPSAIADATSSEVGPLDAQILRLQIEAQQPERAPAYLERLGWAFVEKARASFDAGFYTLAQQAARCLESARPGSAAVKLLQGHIFHNLHEFKAAETLAQQLVRDRGSWTDYGLLGDALLEQGKLEEAHSAYQAMMDQRPGPQAYVRAAQLRFLKGDLEGAMEMAKAAVRTTSPRATEAAAWARTQAARFSLRRGRLVESNQWLESALEVRPNYPPALLVRGRIALMRGEVERAVAALRTAARVNPSPQYQWALLEALELEGHGQEAEAIEASLLKHGAQEDPRTLALFLTTRGMQIETALRLTSRELAAREDVFTLDARAWALYAAGKLAESHELSERALAEGTQDARLFFHAGVIAAAAGQPKRAAQFFARATGNHQTLLPSERAQLQRYSTSL